MTRPHVAFKRRTSGFGTEYHCSRCDRYLPETAFNASAIKHSVPRCRRCRTETTFVLRNASDDHRVAYTLYDLEHRLRGFSGTIPVSFATAALDAGGRRSALSGATERLRLRRYWPDLPLTVENTVVVTANENRRLGRVKDWHALMPADLVARMAAWRAAQLGAALSSPTAPAASDTGAHMSSDQ